MKVSLIPLLIIVPCQLWVIGSCDVSDNRGLQVLAAPTPKPAKPVRMSRSLLKKIEDIKGSKLTPAQEQQLHQATQKMEQNLLPSHQKFIQTVSRITGVSIAKVQESAVKPGKTGSIDKLIVNLSVIGGRSINKQQRTGIEAADQERKRQILVVRDQYSADIAKITGLKVEEVRTILPRVGL
jgi:hypothetical protein